MRTFQVLMRSLGRQAASVVAVIAISGITAMAAAAQARSQPRAAKKSNVTIVLAQPAQPKSGENQFEVTVKGEDGKPIENADVSVLLVMPPMGEMGEMRNEVKLKSAGAGKYTGSGNVMMAGKWNATVTVKQNGKQLGQKKVVLTAK